MTTAATGTATYKLNPALWDNNRKKIMRIMMVGISLPILSISAVNVFQRRNDPRVSMATEIVSQAFIAVLVILFAYLFARRYAARAKRKYDSFVLFLETGGMRRQQLFVAELYVPFSAITSANKVQGKGMMVESRGNLRLWIPDELIGYETVCATLQANTGQYREAARMPAACRPWVFLPVYGFALIAMLMSNSIGIVAVAGVVSVAMMTYLWVFNRRSAGIERSQKRSSALIAIFVLLAFLLRLSQVWHK